VENVAALDHTTLVRLLDKLIAYGITAVIAVIAYLVLKRARIDPAKPASIDAIKHSAEVSSAVPLVIYGLVLVGVVVLAGLLGAPLWSIVFLVPVAIWAGWWMPGRRRWMTSQASVFVQGTPSRVSAFVADVPKRAQYGPGVVSCTPEVAGPRGPRYRAVERGPEGGEVIGVYVTTRDEPGVEVDIQAEGAGATGDYFTFAARDGGTLVTQRTVVELPYLLALIGGTFMARGEAPAAQQRRINEVQALKTAFESGV